MALSPKSLAWGITWGATVALTTGVLVHAFNPQPDPPGHYFGMVGISEGQHVSVHVANRKMAVDSFLEGAAVDAFRPADTCQADIRLFDARGRTMARRMGVIAPGASLSLNFTADPPGESDPPTECTSDPPSEIGVGDPPGVLPPGPCRTLVRAAVLFKGRNTDHCLSSFEVTNRMGMSMGFMNPGSIVGFNPQPDPPGAPTKR
jgi:hypothetical protein